jgi:hypothetical protein
MFPKIDCGKDTLSMEVRDEVIEFNFHHAMKYLYNNVYSITRYDQIDECLFYHKFLILIMRTDWAWHWAMVLILPR